MDKKKLLLLASVFALVAVVAAISTATTQYLIVKKGLDQMNAYAAARFYIDDGGGGNDPGGGKEPGKANVTFYITRVGAGSTDTDSTHVIAGRSNVVLTRLEFRSAGGDAAVKKIQFGISADGRAATAEGVSDEVPSVSLKQCADSSCISKSSVGLDWLPIEPTGPAAGTVIAQSTSSNGFFVIPRGESRYFTLEAAVLRTVLVGSPAQADSGTDLYASVALSNFEAVAGNTTITRFATSTGGTSLGVVGTRKVLLRSQPTLSVARPSGAVVVNGMTPVIDITVGADGGAAALKAFGLNINPTGATVFGIATSTTVTNLTSNTPVAVGAVSGSTIYSGGSGDIYIVFAIPEIISPGSPIRYRVKLGTTDVSGTPGAARIITKLDRNEPIVVNSQPVSYFLAPDGNYHGNSTTWIWSDLSDDQAGIETNTDWANAYLIRPFPADTVTVTN